MTLTNADKVLYPATGTTKSDIFDYYAGVAEVMLGHIAGRPATRKRWPNGVDQPAFFEKQLALSAPPWLSRATVAHRSGTTTYPIIDSATGLAWIAQQAALEVHVPQWRFVAEPGSGELNPGPATRLVFDLDPGEGVMMAQLAEVARAVRDLLADIGLVTFPVTSGSKGLHLYTPLDEPVSSRGATVLAKRVAQRLEQAMPALVTSTMTKSLRAGKVFVDWSQNSGSKTTIAPYSLRGRTHPTVAAPRTWAELDDPALRQLSYDEVLTRIARDGDLLERLDADAPVADRLTRYRRMRDASKTPEPIPTAKPVTGDGNTFERAPITDALITHSNGDHTHGTQLLDRSVRIIAAKGTSEEIEHGPAPEMLARIQTADLGPVATRYLRDRFGHFDFSGIKLRNADLTFDRDLAIELGGRRVDLLNLGPAHTTADSVVHVADAGVLFAGDLLFIGCTPIVWAGPIANWVAACDAMIALDAPTVVPGHGPVTGPDGIRAVRGYLAHIAEQAEAAYRKGLSLPEAVETIDLGEYASWLDSERVVVNVYQRYRELDPDTPRQDLLALLVMQAEWAARHCT